MNWERSGSILKQLHVDYLLIGILSAVFLVMFLLEASESPENWVSHGIWTASTLAFFLAIYALLFLVTVKNENGSLLSVVRAEIHDIRKKHRFDIAFCSIFSILALVIGYFLLTPHGAGLSDDSLDYLMTAGNLLKSGVFLQSNTLPITYTLWAPLYPVAVSWISHLGISVEEAARLISVASFALLMYPLWFLGLKTGNRIVGCGACVIALVFFPFWYVTSMALSEPLFILFSTAAVFFITVYISKKEPRTSWLILSAFFASLAILTRYIGIVIILACVICIVIRHRTDIRGVIRKSLLYLLLSGVPAGLWLIRNYLHTRAWFGHDKGVSDFQVGYYSLAALKTIRENIFGPSSFLSPWVIVGVGALVISCLAVYRIWLEDNRLDVLLPDTISLRCCIPVALVVVGYLGALVISKSVWKLIDPINTRLVTPVYPFLIVLVLALLVYLAGKVSAARRKPAVLAVIGIIGVFAILQVPGSVAWSESIRDGQGYANIHFESESPLVQWVKTNVSSSEAILSTDLSNLYFDYKYRIPADMYPRLYLFGKPHFETQVLNALEYNSKINFILDESQNDPNKIDLLRQILCHISQKNNLTFEYLTLESPGATGYVIIRVGGNSSVGNRSTGDSRYASIVRLSH